MITKMQLVQEIQKAINGKYRLWFIGITHDPVVAKKLCNHPKFWRQWKSVSPHSAEKVKSKFLKWGLIPCERHEATTEISGAYVYIY
jgi:hypothetical protein